MGSCFSKPQPDAAAASAAAGSAAGPAAAAPSGTGTTASPDAAAVPAQRQHAPADPGPPPDPDSLPEWRQQDVAAWAADLNLPQAASALQGCNGAQLLQLTDKGLLQLGMQDAAERQALLAARKSLQQRQQDAQQQQQQLAQQDEQQPAAAAGAGGSSVAGARDMQQQGSTEGGLPSQAAASADGARPPSRGSALAAAGQAAQPEAAGNGSTAGAGKPNNRAVTVRFSGGEGSDSASAAGGNSQLLTRLSDDTAGRLSDVGETASVQVLRITSTGRLFRHTRPVPLLLVPFCQAVCMLNDLRRATHYHHDNCHKLLTRYVLVQDFLLSLSYSELLQQHGVLLAQLSLLMQDTYDVFSQFSERGWLLRLLQPVRDQADFNRMDQQLLASLQQAGIDTSAPPLAELALPCSYPPQQQPLECALKQFGGIERLLRDSLSATLRLQSLMNHLPSGSNIEALLQQEIECYQSSSLPLLEPAQREGGGSYPGSSGPGRRSSQDTFSRVGSGSSGGTNSGSLPKFGGVLAALPSGGGSGSGGRLSSSAGRLQKLGAVGSAAEPFMVLRNDTVRSEWRAVFSSRERVLWKDFWHKLVHPQAHIWGLDRQLDKFTTEYVQQHLQRGSRGLLTLAELDFAFPPNVSPAMVIQARLKGHMSSSSAGLSHVNLSGSGSKGGAGGSSSAGGGGGAAGGGLGGSSGGVKGVAWLREVRLLQEPNPRLHNFPEFPASYVARDEDVSELVLSMADVSTNLVMLAGSQGVGRSMLAASLAQELVNSQHWTDAFWIDLQGVTNVVLAGQHLMAGLGLVSDVADTQQLLAWLEGRPRERFGIVLTHVQELVMAQAEEHQGFLDLLDNILHSSHKLQVILVCDEALSRITYSARTVDVGPLTAPLATEMVVDAQPDVTEEECRFLVEVCSGAPVALAVVCNLLRYGYCRAAEFIRVYSDPQLPLERSMSDTSSTSFLPFESRVTNERLQRVLVASMVNLPDQLVSALFVLSMVPAPFTLDLAEPLLALAETRHERIALLRRLVTLGLLSYTASLEQYTMHKMVREAGQLLLHNLGLPYAETRRKYAEHLVGSARRLVLPLTKKNHMLSARLAWSRIAVHIVQLVNWAFQEVRSDMLHLYVSLAWDLTPLLSSSCGSHTLQGFCQVVLERAQFLDANLESAKMMTVLGALLGESGALKRADTLLRQALELFWRELKEPHPAVARCYRELGALMLKAGKAAEAATHLQQAVEIKEPLYGTTSPELLNILQLQVELLRRSRKYAEAEGVCQRALGICGAAYGPSDVQVAFWKNQLAQVLRQAGRLSEAQSLSEESLALLQSQLGSEHPRVAAQLMILGQLAAQQNKQAVAEQTFRKALQVYQSVSGLHHPDTFNCLTSLVALLRGAGKAGQALPMAQRCLAVKKKSLGELHPDTAAAMQVVADVMLDLGRFAEVEAHCSRAAWVYQQINQPANSKPVITATTMQALALVLLGRASEAEAAAASCLEAAKQLPGPATERNSFVASCFNCLGEVLREMGRLADAEAAAREGLAMREKDMGPNHPVVAISLQTLGHVLRLRQQLPEALEVARRCEMLRSASTSQAHGPQMAAVLHLQALTYLDMGEYGEALSKAQAALALRQKVLSSDHPDLAHSLAVVSEILLLQNKHAEAEPLLSHAVQIFIAQLGSSHTATQRAHTLLKQATNPHTTSTSMSMAMRLASGSTDLGSRLVSRELSRSGSMPAPGGGLGVAATAGSPSSAAGSGLVASGSGSQLGSRTVSAGRLVGVELEAVLTGEGGAGQQRVSDGVSPAASTSATRSVVSISTTIGAAAQSSSPQGSAFMDLQHRTSSASTARSGSLGGAAAAGGEAAAAAAAAGGASDGAAAAAGAEGLSADAAVPSSSVGSLAGGIAAVVQAGGVPAAASANPAEWELGRQLGQPVASGSGTADADTGAYTMVLAELTRRASNTGGPLDEDKAHVALHEEGLGGDAAAITASRDVSAGKPPMSPAGATAAVAAAGGVAAVLAAGGAAATAAALERATSAASAASAGAEDNGRRVRLIEDEPADASLLGHEERDSEAAVTSKVAKMQGTTDITELAAFLREHGWQLSRLSADDTGGAGSRGLLPGAEAAAALRRSTAGGGAVSAQPPGSDGDSQPLESSTSAPLTDATAAAAMLAAAAAAGGSGSAAGQLRGPPPPSAASSGGMQGGPASEGSPGYRKRPSRHYSFLRAGMGPAHPHPQQQQQQQQQQEFLPGDYGSTSPRHALSGIDEEMLHSLQMQGVLTPSQAAALHAAMHQQQHHARADSAGWDANWTQDEEFVDEELAAEQLYYQPIEAARQQRMLMQDQAYRMQQQHGPPPPRARSAQPPASATWSQHDLAAHLHLLRQMYDVPYPDDDAMSATSMGHHSSSSALLRQQQQQQQHMAAPAVWQQQGRGRQRRGSFDSLPPGAAQHASMLAPAAAAAAAACGIPQQGVANSDIEMLRLQQQHLSSVLAAQQQYDAGLAAQGSHDYAMAAMHMQGAGGPSLGYGHSAAALTGSGGSRGSAQSSLYGYSTQGSATLAAAAAGALGPAVAAAAAAVMQRGGGGGAQQQGSLSPAGSVDVLGLSAPPPVSGGRHPAMPPGAGLLPKYPSNISSYSNMSVGSGRSASATADMPGVHLSGSHVQQQHPYDQMEGVAGAPLPNSGRSSRMGAASPEAAVLRQHHEQQQQQQQQILIAARARSALGISRQGSLGDGGAAGLASGSMVSPRQQQPVLQQQGSDDAPPSGLASQRSSSSRSRDGGRRPPSAAARMLPGQGGGEDERPHTPSHYQQQQQQLDGDMSPRYAAAAAGGYSRAQLPRQMAGHFPPPRSPRGRPQQQQQQLGVRLHPDEEAQQQQYMQQYGQFSPHGAASMMYADPGMAGAVGGEHAGYWPGEVLAPGAAAAAGMYASAPLAQLAAGSAPPSAGSTHDLGMLQRLLMLAGVGGGGQQQQQLHHQQQGLPPQGFGGGRGQAFGAQALQHPQPHLEHSWEDQEVAAVMQQHQQMAADAEAFGMLQEQVAHVHAARVELESQAQQISALLSQGNLSPEQQQQLMALLEQREEHPEALLERLNLLGPRGAPGQQQSTPMQGMGSGSSSRHLQQQQQQRMASPGSGLPPTSSVESADNAPRSASSMLQRATSTASTASTGSMGNSPRSAHRNRAAAAAAMAAASAAGAARAGSAEGAAAGSSSSARGGEAGMPGTSAGNNAMPAAPAGSYPPSSPSASSSMSSRPALSRGTSGNQEAQLAMAARGSAARAAAGQQAGASQQQQQQQQQPGQRSLSPDRYRRPGSAASAANGQGGQQRPLHRLHRDNSYDQQQHQPYAAEQAEAAGTGSVGLQGQRAGMGAAGTQAQRSPMNAPPRGAPMPAHAPRDPALSQAWQQHVAAQQRQAELQQQLQQMPPQQYVQLMLAAQQQQIQQQQQQGIARRQPRMSSPSMQMGYSGPAPPSPVSFNSGHLPLSAQLSMLPQQQLSQPLAGVPPGGGYGPRYGSGSSARLAGGGRGYPPGPAAGFQGSPSPGRMMSPAAAGGRMGSISVSRAGMQQQQQQQYAASFSAGLPSYHQQPVMQHQQQQLMMQQQQRDYGEAVAAMAAAAGAGRSFVGNAPHLSHAQRQQQYAAAGLGSTEEEEDYSMWAADPDFGVAVAPGSGGEGGAGSNSRSNSRVLIAPSGGQYWSGRRSNSWSNLQDAVAAGQLVVAPSAMQRSRSSEDIPVVLEGQEAAYEQQQERERTMQAVMQQQQM